MPGGTYSDVVSAVDWGVVAAEIFLVVASDGGYAPAIHGAALVRRGNRVATHKVRINFRNYLPFAPPLPLDEVERALDTRLRAHLLRATTGYGTRVPPKTWAALVATLGRLRPDAADALATLEAQRTFSATRFGARPGAQVVAFERDAVNLAWRAAGGDPAQILAWRPPAEDAPLAPFLTGLPDPVVYEDRMIEHDARVFGDWRALPEDRDSLRGAFTFERPGGGHLTVMNVNRTPVEHTLGVDLVYYVRRYDAYLLVQYKRMEREDGPAGRTAGYRPLGRSYQRELARMRELSHAFSDPARAASPDGPSRGSSGAVDAAAGLAGAAGATPTNSTSAPALPAYRLHAGACFFKLCPADDLDVMSPAMLPGMYLPLDYWEHLVASPAVTGTRGGTRVTFENAGRYVNNTLFVMLAQDGWVGSRLRQTEAITRYIQAALAGRRSVTLAVDTRRGDAGAPGRLPTEDA